MKQACLCQTAASACDNWCCFQNRKPALLNPVSTRCSKFSVEVLKKHNGYGFLKSLLTVEREKR